MMFVKNTTMYLYSIFERRFFFQERTEVNAGAYSYLETGRKLLEDFGRIVKF